MSRGVGAMILAASRFLASVMTANGTHAGLGNDTIHPEYPRRLEMCLMTLGWSSDGLKIHGSTSRVAEI